MTYLAAKEQSQSRKVGGLAEKDKRKIVVELVAMEP